MNILVKTENPEQEKILFAFLDSLEYNYKLENGKNMSEKESIELYNTELNKSEEEIENGNYIYQREVEEIIKTRRNGLNGH